MYKTNAAANARIDPSVWLNMSPTPIPPDDPIAPHTGTPFSMVLTLLPLIGLLCLISWKQMLPFFATKVRLGPGGAEEVLPVGDITDYEKGWLEKLIPELKASIDKGVEFANAK